jgi:uncharacterized protein YecE (DUF72 family)
MIPQEPVENFLGQIPLLREHSGPVLFQLPNNWLANQERLQNFLQTLQKLVRTAHDFVQSMQEDLRFIFEFGDENWFNERSLAALRDHGAAFYIYHLLGTYHPAILLTTRRLPT